MSGAARLDTKYYIAKFQIKDKGKLLRKFRKFERIKEHDQPFVGGGSLELDDSYRQDKLQAVKINIGPTILL